MIRGPRAHRAGGRAPAAARAARHTERRGGGVRGVHPRAAAQGADTPTKHSSNQPVAGKNALQGGSDKFFIVHAAASKVD